MNKIEVLVTCPECESRDHYPIELKEIVGGDKGHPTWTNLLRHIFDCTGCDCDFVFSGHYRLEVDGQTRKIEQPDSDGTS